MNNRAGKNVPVPQLQYSAYEPTRLQDIQINIDEEMHNKIIEAMRLINKLNELYYQFAIKEKEDFIKLFISSYVRKEALLSSQIEGTQTSLSDILDPNIEKNANLDTQDVVNYVNALTYAINELNTYPICNSLLKRVHKILLKGVRGEDKEPGEFRNSQNWIGPAGCSLKDAKYIPPTKENMLKAMGELENYINDPEDETDPLIKIALIHYQFETIHPFLDGNGRIGRMLIVLYLLEQKILAKPLLYISYYLKKNRIEYYDRLADVRKKGDYEKWIMFFLDAVISTCKDCNETIEEIQRLYALDYNRLAEISTKSTMKVFRYLFGNPIIDVNKTAKDKCITR